MKETLACRVQWAKCHLPVCEKVMGVSRPAVLKKNLAKLPEKPLLLLEMADLQTGRAVAVTERCPRHSYRSQQRRRRQQKHT